MFQTQIDTFRSSFYDRYHLEICRLGIKLLPYGIQATKDIRDLKKLKRGEPFGEDRWKLVEEYRRVRSNGRISKELVAGDARIVREDPLIALDISDYRPTARK